MLKQLALGGLIMSMANAVGCRHAEEAGQDAAFRVDVTTQGTRIIPVAGETSTGVVFLPGMYLLRPADDGDGAYYLLTRCLWSFSTARPLDPGTRAGDGTLSVDHCNLCLHRVSLQYSENWETEYLSLKPIWQFESEGDVVTEAIAQFEEHLGVIRPWHTDMQDVYPTFAADGYLSVACHRRGYSGGAHHWYDLQPATFRIEGDRVEQVKLRHLVPRRWWWLIRWRLVHYFMKEWDRVQTTREDAVPNRNWLKLLLTLGLEGEDALVTNGKNGPAIHLTFDPYTVHSFARGGGRLSLDPSRLPPWIWRRMRLPDGPSLAPGGPAPCDLDTELDGVFADPDRTEQGLPRGDWLVSSYAVAAADSRFISLLAQHVEQQNGRGTDAE